MLVNEAMENINKAQKIAYTNVLKRRAEERDRILNSSKKYTPCNDPWCASTLSLPPPSFGSSATSSIPPITKRSEITAPSPASAFIPAPKKSSEEIVRDTMMMLNSLLPQDKIIDVLIQSIKSRGIEIPSWLEEDDEHILSDEDEEISEDEEELSEEDLEMMIDMSRERLSERRNKNRF
jgi:hypothetical protein